MNSFRPAPSSGLNGGQIGTFQGLGPTCSLARTCCIRMTACTGSQWRRVSRGWQLSASWGGQRTCWNGSEKGNGGQGVRKTQPIGSFHGRKWPTADWSLEKSKKVVGMASPTFPPNWREVIRSSCDLPPPGFRLDLGPAHSLAPARVLGRDGHSSAHPGLQLAKLCVDSPRYLSSKTVH